MLGVLAGGAACAGSALLAWGARGRSSSLFGPSVHHGAPGRQSLALTFDDGPSPGTARLLEILAQHEARATFFQCGVNVERAPELARQVAAAGHEIGNHTYSHPLLALRSARFIESQFARAQRVIAECTGTAPMLLRAPFGVRWFGFRAAQKRLGLTGVMWSVLGRDWTLSASAIVPRVLARVSPGAIICLHDGRGISAAPDIGETIEAVRRLLPELRSRGFRFETVSQILCPTN